MAEGRAPDLPASRRRSAEDIRQAGDTMVCFSEAMQEADAAIKRFLYARMYRHPDVMRGAGPGRRRRCATCSGASWPSRRLMPEEWQADLPRDDEPRLARRVADYIAGMTDRYAILEHRRLFDVTPDLR